MACAALPQDFTVLACHGSESMNALPRWDVRIGTPAAFDAEAVIGTSAVLRLLDAAENSVRFIDLIVISVVHDEDGRDGSVYALELGPPEWLLTRRAGYRTFLDKTTKEIIVEILDGAGLGGDRLTWRLSGPYEKRLYCVQYGETEWGFIERLLADEGISYWFDMKGEDEPKLVFADDRSGYAGIEGNMILPYSDPTSSIGPRHFFELAVTEVLTPTKVHVRDYDVRAPDVFVEGKAGEGALEHFEYPQSTLVEAAATARATARLQQLQRWKRHASGATDCMRLQPGRAVEIEGCSDAWLNGSWLVVGVEHDVTLGGRNDARPSSYTARVLMVPHGDVPFRPDLARTLPKVSGVETGVTTGPSGEEIHVDDLGRVKIRFPWDRSGVVDDKSSYWVRCLQMCMGGSMVLPRVGWEVPVVYVDGNPDRPFVLGRVYNATAVVPYALPGGQATSGLQSATSPGGGTTNEIRMVDDGGSQQMFIHATKDQTVTVGGTRTGDVSVNETHDVGLSLIASVTSSQSHSVGADQSVNVGTNFATTVKGSRTEIVGGMEAIQVEANRVVAVDGAYTELIGALYGIQCNQSNTGVAGAFTQLVGGGMALAGGLGVSETILAARTELVAGAKSLTTRGGVSDTVMGIKNVTAGATKETAGGKIATSTKAIGSIAITAAASMKAGGALVIEAPSITIDGASIKTKQFEIGGGALKVKSGSSTLKGNIKRTGHAKIG